MSPIMSYSSFPCKHADSFISRKQEVIKKKIRVVHVGSEKCTERKKPIVKKTRALMFKDDNEINSFISVPKMDLVFSNFVKCPQHLLDCYAENKYEILICTSNHYMIASNNYKEGLIKFQNKDEEKNSVNSNSAVENVVNMLYETDTSMFIVCKSKYS